MNLNKIAVFLILAACACFCGPHSADAFVKWDKHPANPLLSPGLPGAWDEYSIERPMVIKDDQTYKMWYTGVGAEGMKIGYATSPDGITWTKQGPIVINGASSGWDADGIGFCWVIKELDIYRMWYSGTADNMSWRIGYAESSDGQSWTRAAGAFPIPDPVLLPGPSTDWDGVGITLGEGGVVAPSVVFDPDSGTYKMWYLGFNEDLGHPYTGIGYAESIDGTLWIKYDDGDPSAPYQFSDAVLNLGLTGSWDYETIGSPAVIKADGIFHMWYHGEDEAFTGRIGYTFSPDGIGWTKAAENPVLDATPATFDEYGAYDPMVIGDGGAFLMWYRGEGLSGRQFGLAVSDLGRKTGLAVDFGAAYGLYGYDSGSGWSVINRADPEQMVPVDIDHDGIDELAVGFAGYGLYIYKHPGNWTKINNLVPQQMAVLHGSVLFADSGTAYGLYSYGDVGGWMQINKADALLMQPVDVDNDGTQDMAVFFAGYGLYIFQEPGNWSRINTAPVEEMAAADGHILYVDFGSAYGLYAYDTLAGWRRINSADAQGMGAVDIDADGSQELAVAFPGYGLYLYDDPVWTRINQLAPEDGTVLDKSVLYVDYGPAYGLMSYDALNGWLQRNSADPLRMVPVDINRDGKDELAVTFAGYGLYSFDPYSVTFSRVNAAEPQNMTAINLF
jgi:hypothetical protein